MFPVPMDFMSIYKTCALLLVIFTSCCQCAPHISKFTSHVAFSTPTRSFYHGVGDLQTIRPLHSQAYYGNTKSSPPKTRVTSLRSFHGFSSDPLYHISNHFEGYPKEKPHIAFPNAISQSNSQQNGIFYGDNSIGYFEPYTAPVLPPSPYKVDSPDPESLWPEGLFVPPAIPVKYETTHQQKDFHHIIHAVQETPSNHIFDPYYLDGEDALRAITRAKIHGELFHHDIPHVRALLANQELRISNGLRPHRLGSIRNTSPWFRT